MLVRWPTPLGYQVPTSKLQSDGPEHPNKQGSLTSQQAGVLNIPQYVTHYRSARASTDLDRKSQFLLLGVNGPYAPTPPCRI